MKAGGNRFNLIKGSGKGFNLPKKNFPFGPVHCVFAKAKNSTGKLWEFFHEALIQKKGGKKMGGASPIRGKRGQKFRDLLDLISGFFL